MTENEKIEKVKYDLRLLRRTTHAIEVSLSVKERHEKRLAVWQAAPDSPEKKEEIQN